MMICPPDASTTLLEKRRLRIEPSEGPLHRVMIESGAPFDSCGASEVRARIFIDVDDCLQHRKITGIPGVFGHACSIASGADNRGAVHVDAVNTFRVSAGRRRSFRVVSRHQIQRFRRSRRFMRLVRFPAAPLFGKGRNSRPVSSLRHSSVVDEFGCGSGERFVVVFVCVGTSWSAVAPTNAGHANRF